MDRDQDGGRAPAVASRPLEVEVGYDAASCLYYALSSDILGLHIEASTFESFVEIAKDALPDLASPERNSTQIRFNRTIDLAAVDGR